MYTKQTIMYVIVIMIAYILYLRDTYKKNKE